MIRVSASLLRKSHRLLFGGTLGDKDKRLTEHLIDTTQVWLNEDVGKAADINIPETWPLTNYAAWPHYTKVLSQRRARLVGICNFIDIDPNGTSKRELSRLADSKEPQDQTRVKLEFAAALTQMRQESAKLADMRIVWGGKIRGSSGWLPGIFEEVGCTLDEERPVLIFGGFGGCARKIASFLTDPKANWPVELDLSSCASAERDQLLTEEERQQLVERADKYKRLVSEYRTKLQGETEGVLYKALSVTSLRGAVQLAQEFVKMVASEKK